MSVLMILNKTPYDKTDTTWNIIRLAQNLLEKKVELRIFLMNDAVDLAKDACRKDEHYEHDLVIELKKLRNHGLILKACGNCKTKCGNFKDEPYYDKSIKGTMYDLSDFIISSDKVLNF